MKPYKFGFDAGGLLLFAVIMVPNFIWFAVPAPNDVLRTAAAHPLLDAVASVSQVVFVAALCFVVRRERKERPGALRLAVLLCVAAYFVGWIAYYVGNTGQAVLLTLAAAPCAAFILFAVERENVAALIPAVLFAVCHIGPYL